ncbi:MAG: dTDP-4-dehydrorhamnose 3,5-epimerase family protein [Alphaproteobacteria bacterium]|nr:dTDP-4-dehydrorhamnose 3,5-epimerase family protein [Alphaproteobacteria bacterium]
MNFTPLPVAGAFAVTIERQADARGSFARAYDERAFAARGLNTRWPQHNFSFSRRGGTLRGLHWQADPHGEVKLVRCTRGSAHDVVVDLRADSPSYLQHACVEMSVANGVAVYIPLGCAHGVQSLEDDTELHYLMGAEFVPAAFRGLRWDDPALGIRWPIVPPTLSERDAALPVLDSAVA